jgi:hypothetical protein
MYMHMAVSSTWYRLCIVLLCSISSSHPQLSTSHQIFPGLNLLAVMNTITHGERPPRPQALRATPFFDCIWRLIDSCWAQEEAKRPTMVQVLGQLHHAPHDGPIMRTTTVMSSDGLSTQPDEEGSQTVTG